MVARTTLMGGLAAALVVLAPAVAIANPTPIVVGTSDDFHHALTGIAMPVSLGGFAREGMSDFGKQQLDIQATYQQPASGTTATVYLFRAGLPDASIWHDRVLAVIDEGRLGRLDRDHAITAPFTVDGHGAGSGIRSALPLTGKGYLATGIAMLPHDSWLLAVRMSSTKLGAAELDALLARFTAGIVLPKAVRPAAAAYAIAPCAEGLPTKAASRAQPDLASALMAGVVLDAAMDNAEAGTPEEVAAPAHWCRDAASNAGYGVYRSGPPADGYTIALGDAGVVLGVYPDSLGALLGRKGKPTYALRLTTTEMSASFAPFKTLPTVAQVVQVLSGEAPMASSPRPIGKDDKRTINIGPGLVK